MTEGSYGRRMAALAAVLAFLFAALVTRLWFLQVLAAEEYEQASFNNHVRTVPLVAPRGRILDRNGEPLVTNRASTVIMVDRTKVENEEELLANLAGVLNADPRELGERLHDPDYFSYQPVPVFEDAPKPAVLYIAEHPEEFPGVSYEVTGLRDYVHGDLAPHVLGYLGEVSPEELDDPSFSEVLPGQKVGRGGVEQQYESFLRGDNGRVRLRVDATGKVLEVLGREEPTPGNDLQLSLDWEIQALAQDTMDEAVEVARGIFDPNTGGRLRATAGAVVVLDAQNGQVLALASYPTYDPRVFLGGLTHKEFARLRDPERNSPLSNRAIAGLYPPASTFKPFVAAAAIRTGIAEPNGHYPCPPEFVVPGDESGQVFRNWKSSHSGVISLGQSLIESCDTVFYQFGLDFYRARQARGEVMQEQLRRWGFGRRTGVDVPGEARGRVPDAKWKKAFNEGNPGFAEYSLWLPGDNINLSIGQGDMLVTPLQLAVAYGALANGGTMYRPQLGWRVVSPDGEILEKLQPLEVGKVPARPEVLDQVRGALRGVLTSGTASTAFAGFAASAAGKTGTAEVTLRGRDALHSWFAAMAPADDPRYVVVSVVEEGGHGSEVAAPIVRRVLEGLMGLTPGEFSVGAPTD